MINYLLFLTLILFILTIICIIVGFIVYIKTSLIKVNDLYINNNKLFIVTNKISNNIFYTDISSNTWHITNSIDFSYNYKKVNEVDYVINNLSLFRINSIWRNLITHYNVTITNFNKDSGMLTLRKKFSEGYSNYEISVYKFIREFRYVGNYN